MAPPTEQKKRQREKWTVIVLAILVLSLGVIEIMIARHNSVPMGQSVLLFSVINFNILIFLILVFFSFRNVAKVFFDKSGPRRPSLRRKLVLAFTLFATIPTVLLSTTAAYYVYQSFEKWFSARIVDSFQQSLHVTQAYYDEIERRSLHWAKYIREQLDQWPDLSDEVAMQKLLDSSVKQFDLDWVAIRYGLPPKELTASLDQRRVADVTFVQDELDEVVTFGKSHLVTRIGSGELSRVTIGSRKFPGLAISVGLLIPLVIAEKSGSISTNLDDFKKLLPVQKAVKTTFLMTLAGMVLLILAFSSWLGVYISRRLIKPLEAMTEATHELAEGHFAPIGEADESIHEYKILQNAFNEMGQKILQAQKNLESANRKLSDTNTELEHEKSFLEVLVQSVDFGVLAFDSEGRLTISNSAIKKILGIPDFPSQAMEVSIAIQSILPRFSHFLSQMNPDRAIPRTEMEEYLFHDAKNILVRMIGIPLSTRSKEYSGIVFIFEDLTQLQSIQRSLAWKEVARRLAHEFKNPLTPIRLSAERLHRNSKNLTEDMVGGATRSIIKSVEQLTQLVDEFSRYSKLPEVQLEEGSIVDCVMGAVEIYRQAHPQIEFTLKIDDDIPKFLFDEKQLGRALSNLIKNSVQVLQNETHGKIGIQITYKRRLGVVTLMVWDNGPGLSDAVARRLFEPYFSTKSKGTGLGLAIVQRIVQDHQGVIRVQRNTPKGTRFMIDLPLRRAEERVAMAFEVSNPV